MQKLLFDNFIVRKKQSCNSVHLPKKIAWTLSTWGIKKAEYFLQVSDWIRILALEFVDTYDLIKYSKKNENFDKTNFDTLTQMRETDLIRPDI